MRCVPTLRLRYLFVATFALVAVLPAAALTGWVANQALSQEKRTTGAKQRHLAQVVAFGLERYANDARAAFEHMASLDDGLIDQRATYRLARNLGFRFIVHIGQDGKTLEFTDFEHGSAERIPADLLTRLAAQASQSPEFLPVVRDGSGEPTVFIIEGYPDGTAIAAALSTQHIRATQREVSFGIHGHAVIVDQVGQVIAHPKEEWESEIRSIARVAPIQAAIRGETGFDEFLAPARGEMAMAGYARSAAAGWGVIAVRPMPEIVAVAWDYAFGAAGFIALGLLAALVLAAAMARVIVRPVERAAKVAQRLSRGDLSAQVDPVPQVPVELGELSRTINSLAASLNLWRLDVTESLEEAQASSREKTNFLASLSHEIRSPLTTIIGFAETLQDAGARDRNPEKTAEYAADIVAAGRHLVSLIDGVLELSQTGEGQLTLSTRPVALDEAVAAVTRVMQAQADREKIELRNSLPAELPAVAANAGKLKQALLNLISNAIKFTPEGGSVTVNGEANTNGSVSVSVQDTGIGMSRRDLELALRPFGRVQNAWTRGRTGTGLGLPLARQLVEEMGGTFGIDSVPGRGTTVTLTFPAVALSKAA